MMVICVFVFVLCSPTILYYQIKYHRRAVQTSNPCPKKAFILYLYEVAKQKKILVNIEIDKLTNSIENVISGDLFDTDIFQLNSKDTKQINKADWQFNWHEQ